MSNDDKLNLILSEVRELKAEVKTLDKRMDEMTLESTRLKAIFGTVKWIGIAVLAAVTVGIEGVLKLKWW
jgi:hypothetical protein